MKQKIIPVLIVIAGFLLLSYPFVSNFIFEKSVGSTVKSYEKKSAEMRQDRKQQFLEEAKQYNLDLKRSKIQLTDPFKIKKTNGEMLFYNNILTVDKSGIMGYLKIPCISLELPIYHGTSAKVLEHGIGHLASSSFPIGGKDTHSVLTGHTGLSSAKLFTDLTEMKKGDFFFVYVLDQKLSYRVDQIMVVKPEDTRKLRIIDGEDHVTLLTCTPYGINDHRLLVRGVRTTYKEDNEKAKTRSSSSQWMKVYKRSIFIGIIIVFVLVGVKKECEGIKARRGSL